LKSKYVPLVAAVLTILLHGVIFCVPAYFIYMDSKVKSQKSKVEQNLIPVEIAMLPAIKNRGEKSAIKQAEGKKSTQQQDQGLAGQAAKQGNSNTEAEMLSYQDIIKQRIQEARRYPPEARKQGIEGGVEMSFTILQGGQLKNAVITGTSGNQSLDAEALATISRAAPFPPVPADAQEQEMTMRLRIIFKIE
jgi:protein TonB